MKGTIAASRTRLWPASRRRSRGRRLSMKHEQVDRSNSSRCFGDFLALHQLRTITRIGALYRSVGLLLKINHNWLTRHKESSVCFREQLLRIIAKRRVLQVQLSVALS